MSEKYFNLESCHQCHSDNNVKQYIIHYPKYNIQQYIRLCNECIKKYKNEIVEEFK